MLLSIAMIVRDEEKHLDRTLSALQPLMHEVESELIIVDTGSVDRSVEIAKKYTDKVYFKEWSGNFAEMRNESIKYATGEWILVVDADEELIDYSEFIDFIKTGKSKYYNTGFVQIKSFFDEDCVQTVDSPMPRLFRNEKDFAYTSRIHEQPKYKKPVYSSSNGIMTFNHYGYIFNDELIRQKKLKRNEELLFEELEVDPNNGYINYQLAQNFMILNKPNQALVYIEKSVNIYKKNNQFYIPASTKLISCYFSLSNYEQCEKECINYLKEDKCNIDVYYYLATSQIYLSKYKESIYNFEKYFYYIENYHKSTQATSIVCRSETMILNIKAICNYCNALFSLKKYDKVIKIVEEKIENIGYDTSLYHVLIKSLFKLNRYEDIYIYYNKYAKLESQKMSYIYSIETLPKDEREKINKVYSIMSNIEGNYGILNKIRVGYDFKNEEVIKILNIENNDFYGELLIHFFKKNKNFEEIIDKVNFLRIPIYLNYIIKNKKEVIPLLYKKVLEFPIRLDIKTLFFKTSLMESLIFNDGLSKEKKDLLFKYYLIEKYRLIKKQYIYATNDEDFLCLTKDINDYMTIKIKLLNETRKENQVKYIQEIKNISVKYPQYKDVLKSMIDNFMNNKNIESKEISSLKTQYLSMIEKNIQDNNIEIVNQMIEEYTQINGIDEEILNIKSICKIIDNDYEKALEYLELSYKKNGFNYDVIYNIAYVNELLGNIEEACEIYKALTIECNDTDITNDANSRILEIESNR